MQRIETGGLTSLELEESVNALQTKVLDQLALGKRSKISHGDAMALNNVFRAVRDKKGLGHVVAGIYKSLRQTASKDKLGNYKQEVVPFLRAAEEKAYRVLHHEGGTPEQAFEAGLVLLNQRRIFITYPAALPIDLGIPIKTKKWTRADYIKADDYLRSMTAKFTSARERDEMFDKMDRINAELEAREDAAAAAATKSKGQ